MNLQVTYDSSARRCPRVVPEAAVSYVVSQYDALITNPDHGDGERRLG